MWVESVARQKRATMAWSHEQSTDLLLELFDDTLDRLQASLCWLSAHTLGNRIFTVAANDAKAADLLTHCLLPAESKPGVAPYLEIFVCAGSAAPFLCPPKWNFPHTDPRHLERLHLTSDGKVSAFYDEDREFWMILDMNTRRALLWIADAERLPAWETAAPFKQILQWSMVDTPLSMLHGGAVAHSGHGVLLVGAGGSGKSTTVAACVQEGLGVCGDDLVMVSRSPRSWRVYAIYDSIKLLPNAPIAVPPLLGAAPWRECGDKRSVRYSDVAAGTLAASAPLRAIMHCRITDNEMSRLVPITSAEMLKAIGPPTVFLLRGRESHILKEVNALIRSLPCMRLELGKTPAQAAGLLGRWLENHPCGESDE
jgi:hypothetical protein